MRAGRPLRFLGVFTVGWIGVRTVLLLPVDDVVAPRLLSKPAGFAALPFAPVVTTSRVENRIAPIRPLDAQTDRRAPTVAAAVDLALIAPRPADRPSPSSDIARQVGRVIDTVTPPVEEARLVAPLPLPLPPTPPAETSPSRWSGSAWAIARGSGSAGGLSTSQLGGSQAGARLAYALDEERRVAIVGRFASPLGQRGKEAALGAELRLAGGAIRLFVERRFAFDGGRGGPSVGLIGGLYRELPGGVRLEAYGQAGAIRRDRAEAFVDAAARASRPVAAVGPVRLDVGLGAWGGAQRGAERLDVGPSVGLATAVAGKTLRVTADWRQRIAGGARPGSGPAVSIGTDF
ncbi:MAG TPA: hypothetical protein VF636_05465 [Sphingomonas sp.]